MAGKGHEKYQEIKGVKYPFDDKAVLKEMFEILGKKPLVVIRINPDKKGKNKACFNISNGKITPIENVWNQRKKELIAYIRLYLTDKPDSDITEECIGYD